MHNITKVDNSNQLNNLKLYKTSHKKFISINDEYKFSFNSIDEVLNYRRLLYHVNMERLPVTVDMILFRGPSRYC